jgi:hypothetical protein
MSTIITRRKALKLIAATTTAAALSPVFHARARYPIPTKTGTDVSTDIWTWMGRAIHALVFYEQPATSATRLDRLARDQTFQITREVRAPFSSHNNLWYETPLGYVHSAWVLPVRVYSPQPFIRNVGEWGFWGEVSQPYTEAYEGPSAQSKKAYRFYGGTVYHVIDTFEDEHGTGWYKVYDEFPPTDPTHQWVLARDVRRIPREEIAPIRPFVGGKRIEVDLDKQRLTCFEGSRIVFTTLVASGLGVSNLEDGGILDLATPVGETHVLLKQPSRHMSNRPYLGGPPLLTEIFDLPGIPWNTFFNLSGTAIHGTYWHNDFGVRRSHGCVNVSSSAARWIYRWVHPVGGYEDDYIQSDRRVGTPINIF